MPKYLCLQRSLSEQPREKPSPSQMEEMFAAFRAWEETFKDNLPDLGGHLGNGTLVRADAETDGPFVEVKELVGGYMVVSADTLDEAVSIASQCPGLVQLGSGVEVIEIRSP
ncbi:MAG: YciI family protein [Rubricoccaceae bacterium]